MSKGKDYQRLAVHNSACNEVYFAVQDCERDHPFGRIIGQCSEYHVNLQKCIKQQRAIQQDLNSRKSKERLEKVKKSLPEDLSKVSN